jgi:adenylylsulfate kinase-like enzyme
VRDEVRQMVGRFVEVYVTASLDVLIERDTKGLYRRALAGEVANFTGISDPYEPPLNPEVVVETGKETIEQSVARILQKLRELNLID